MNVAEIKTKMTIADAGTGADVWMIIEDVHKTKPLLVTIGNVCTEMHVLMPQYYINIHDREGMEGKEGFHRTLIVGTHSLVSANDICYLNEEDAQKELDKRVAAHEYYRCKTMDMYFEYVGKHIKEILNNKNMSFDSPADEYTYKQACVDMIMYLRNHKYLLDKQPEIEGITSFKSFLD